MDWGCRDKHRPIRTRRPTRVGGGCAGYSQAPAHYDIQRQAAGWDCRAARHYRSRSRPSQARRGAAVIDPSLKPCPFCGAAAELHEEQGSYGYTPPSVQVRCSKSYDRWIRREGLPAYRGAEKTCFAETHSEDIDDSLGGKKYEDDRARAHGVVAAAWNRRDGEVQP
jgi:hypothetical protein